MIEETELVKLFYLTIAGFWRPRGPLIQNKTYNDLSQLNGEHQNIYASRWT